MRKLLGYRLKDEFSNYEKAAAEIAYEDLNRQVGLSKNGSRKINFNPGCVVHDRLEAAGVMHWFEEVYEEEKLEVGEWYKDKTCDAVLIYFSGNREKGNYGFNRAGKWTNEYSIHNTPVSDYRPATTEEIQQALIKEAKKRGFKDKSRITYVDNDSELIDFSSPNYSSRGNWFELGVLLFLETENGLKSYPTKH